MSTDNWSNKVITKHDIFLINLLLYVGPLHSKVALDFRTIITNN